MLEKQQLASARSTVSVIVNIITFGLPGLAVFILSRYGARPLFVADAISFLLAAVILARISHDVLVSRKPAPTSPTDSDKSERPLRRMGRDIKVGFVYLWHKRDVRLLTLAGVFNAACGGVVLSQYVVLAHDTLGLTSGDARYSLFVYAATIGGTLGSLCFPKVKTWCSAVTLSVWLFGANALLVVALCWSQNLVVSLVVFGLYQATYSAIIMNAIVLRMEIVDEEYLGRVSATGRFISWGAAPIGALIGGAFINWGNQVQYVIAGFALLPVIGCLFLLVNQIRATKSAHPSGATDAE